MLKPGEAARLVWMVWWVGLSAFAATIADRQLATQQQKVATKEELIATFEVRDRETLAKATALATEQGAQFKAASARVQARRDVLPDSRSTGWLVTLVHDLARTHGCTVNAVEITARAVEPKESGLHWLRAVAHLRGNYPGLRAWVTALAASPPGQPTGGVPLRQITYSRPDKASDVHAEYTFEVLSR